MVEKAEEQLGYWQSVLNLSGQQICLEEVLPIQVYDELTDLPNNSLVGISFGGEGRATIFHTQPLQPDDFVHELLHLRHPDWSDEQIVLETERLMGC